MAGRVANAMSIRIGTGNFDTRFKMSNIHGSVSRMSLRYMAYTTLGAIPNAEYEMMRSHTIIIAMAGTSDDHSQCLVM